MGNEKSYVKEDSGSLQRNAALLRERNGRGDIGRSAGFPADKKRLSFHCNERGTCRRPSLHSPGLFQWCGRGSMRREAGSQGLISLWKIPFRL